MSATRPATEFSIGIMPRSASPAAMAASASSNVAQGIGSASGKASSMAMWELAPASPWNTIVSFLVIIPYSSRSSLGKNVTGRLKVVRRVDAARHCVDNGHVDTHARFQRAQLLQPLLPL